MLQKAALIAVLVSWPLYAAAQSVRVAVEPKMYRGEPYNAPVPETLAGATVLADDEAAHSLWQSGTAVFVDVFPHTPRPPNLPEGTLFREKKRHSIPGSIWLPNVGYEALADQTDGYFRSGLESATDGDFDATVVIFCRADCWMSWNAAKRALEYGYRNIIWYPDGTDGWTFMEYPTTLVTPFE